MSTTARPAASNWNLANGLTVLRLVLVPLFGWLLLTDDGESDSMRVAAFVVFAVAAATDKFDGELARRRGMVTDFGKVVDPIADKALTGMAFIGLSILGELPWWVTVVVLVREIGVTALRFWVIRIGIIAASRGGKLKTALQTLALGLYILPLSSAFDPVEIVAMALAVIVTVVTGFDYAAQAWRMHRQGQATTS
ncbi:MAG TPA: CDP-diacylglycerol--glycerol-3-phosphate 3-phosphatidyltransferase [Nocardioidaceae bacterium]|jgi:CDP-diacylglycerol---glycerol-3-phosphate 3-phosphatidyltransferase|nr:CDP-diacylglycerol--glycerol-3-phosphate 3-phosphatidyltransferase [Nocardioidaceae bacterium]